MDTLSPPWYLEVTHLERPWRWAWPGLGAESWNPETRLLAKGSHPGDGQPRLSAPGPEETLCRSLLTAVHTQEPSGVTCGVDGHAHRSVEEELNPKSHSQGGGTRPHSVTSAKSLLPYGLMLPGPGARMRGRLGGRHSAYHSDSVRTPVWELTLD